MPGQGVCVTDQTGHAQDSNSRTLASLIEPSSAEVQALPLEAWSELEKA